MKHKTLLALVAVLVVASLTVLPALAQDEAALTAKQAKKELKEAHKQLKETERAQKRGDDAAMQRHLNQYRERMQRVNQSVVNDNIDPAEAHTVLERVDAATRKHQEVLARVHERCQERGKSCEGLERAMEASQRGNQAATEALARTPAAERRAGRPEATGQPGTTGRPDVSGQRGPGGGRPGGSPPSGKPQSGRPPRR
jgi:hypothetical protein